MATLIWRTKSNQPPPPPPRRHRRPTAADTTRCKKHQQQSPGVCSACLREKLSQLPAAAASATSSSSYRTVDTSSSASSLSSCYSSSSSCSSCSSPRPGGGGRLFVSSQLLKNTLMMPKSRSVHGQRSSSGDGGEGNVKGFWSRVLRRRKPTDVRPPAMGGRRSITVRDVIVLHT
ncbi:hypothetical protein LINPERHAP2_LOCUS35685 [Linum perenne]